MWIDEFYTYFVVHQNTAADVVRAINDGADSTPPTYPLLLRTLQPLLGNGVLDLRLPSLFGFCLMCICVFAFAHRRLPAVYALLAMLFACDKMLFFATDGRPYGLILGFSALALVCWQAAAEGRYRAAALPVITLSLWFTTALHYYSITLLGPLFLAEIVRERYQRKLDVPMLASLALVPLVLIPHIPLAEAQRRFIPHFYSRPSLHSFTDIYGNYAQYAGLMVVPLLLYAVFQTYSPAVSEGGQDESRSGLPVHEWVLTITLAILPIVIILGSMLTIRAFVDRYVMLAVLGFSILAAAILCRITRASTVVAVSSIILLLFGFAGKTLVSLKNGTRLRSSEATNTMLDKAPANGYPILVADHHQFVELSYYANPKIRPRLVYAVSPELSVRYAGNDTGELVLSELARCTSMNITTYDDFIRSNRRFLLAANAGDWLLWHLNRSGYRLSLISQKWEPGLFAVEAPDSGKVEKAPGF